jgi:CheY-like chemotaxis protein
LNKKRILIAAGQETVKELGSFFANSDKFEVGIVESGLQACRIIEKYKPHLVFLNVRLPEMNGFECCYKIKKSNTAPETHIILIRDDVTKDQEELCTRACCDAVLNMPLDPGVLKHLVHKYLYAAEINPRFKVRIAIFFGSDQQELLKNYSVNLSTSGVFIETDKVFSLDAPLTVEFMLPVNDTRITCNARVAWINAPGSLVKPQLPQGIGLQFLDLSLENIHAIRDFITKGELSPTW